MLSVVCYFVFTKWKIAVLSVLWHKLSWSRCIYAKMSENDFWDDAHGRSTVVTSCALFCYGILDYRHVGLFVN